MSEPYRHCQCGHPVSIHDQTGCLGYTGDKPQYGVCTCESAEASTPSLPPKSGQSLRDRIAAAVSQAVPDEHYVTYEDAYAVADAVIAELRLKRECRECGAVEGCVCDCPPECCPREHRYITDWKADE